MASKKGPDIPPAGESEKDVDENKRRRSVLITGIPPGTDIQSLIIYFQKTSNGGGEVEDGAEMLADGKAVVIFEEEKVAHRVLQRKHKLDGTLLHLEPCLKSTEGIEVFSLVSAKLDPSRFTNDPKELKDLLIKAGLKFLETCEGFVVSGTLEEVDKSCLFLSRYVKTPNPERDLEISDNLKNGQSNGDPLSDSDDEEKSLKTMVLDIEPKLMYILQKQVNDIEKKCKMKIDWKNEPGKAHLSPNGKDAPLFDQGKEEFIALYQKEFQDLKEMDFTLDTAKNIADLETTTKELMKEFAVVIERKGEKDFHIFGKENHVTQVMQRLQGKFGKRRTRKAYKEPSSGELPMPDTHAQATMLPLSKTLENGVMVSVHQGDITKVQVDVIVNAANEYLNHGGGVAGAIVKQGGQQIQQESDAVVRRYGRIPVGQVAHTGPGNLPYKRIFHAVGPQWKVNGEERSRQLIFDACINSFTLASKQRISSIALPGISSGIYGVPKTICAEIMFAAAEMFSAEASSDNQLKDIRFVNIDTPTYEAFRREFHNRYGLMKGEEADLGSNSYQENANHSSFEAEKEREYQRDANQQRFGSTGKTDHVDTVEEFERKKRADAAVLRMEEDKENKTAEDGEKPREHKTVSKNVPSGNNPSFKDGFDKRENKSNRDKKAVGEQHPRSKDTPTGKDREIGKDEKKEKKNLKRREENKKKEEENEKKEKEKEKKEKEKEKKEKEKEKKEKEKERKEKEKENKRKTEVEKRNKHENEDKVYPQSNMPDQSVEGEEHKDLVDLFSSMEINDEDKREDTLRDSGKTKRNKNNNPEIEDTINKTKVAYQNTSMAINTEDNDSSAKKDDSEIPSETDESSQGSSEDIKEGIPKEKSYGQSFSETNNQSPGNEIRASDRKFSGRGVTYDHNITSVVNERENKSLRSCGRGRGALGHQIAAQFPAAKPGHAVREDTTNFKADMNHKDDNRSSERVTNMPPAPGLTVSKEGLDLAKTNRKENEETRKKNIESESKDGVPFKKAKVDEGNREKNGEVLTKEVENIAKDIEDGDPIFDKSEKGDDKKEVIKAESGISKNDTNSNEENREDKNADRNETVIDKRKEESKAEEKEEGSAASVEATEAKKLMDSKVQPGDDDQRSREDTKDESSAASAEATEAKKPLDSKVQPGDDDRRSREDTKDESSAASAEATEAKKLMDSKVQTGDDDQRSREDTKDESSAASAVATESKTPMDSKVQTGDDDRRSHEDTKDESSAASAEATEAKTPMDSKVQPGDDDQRSHKDTKDENSAASAVATESKTPMDSKVQTGDDDQSSREDTKDESGAASAEATESKTPMDSKVQPGDDDQSSREDTKDESGAASAEATEPKKPIDSKVEGESQSSDRDTKEERKAVSVEGADLKKPWDSNIEPADDGQRSDEKSKEEGKTEYAEATDPKDISNFSGEPSSMNSFVLLDMPSNDHDISSRAARTSGSSDGSSDSIELIEHLGKDEFSCSLPSSPVNDQGDDHAQPTDHDISRSKLESIWHHSAEDNGQGTTQDKEERPLVDFLMAEKKDKKEKNVGTGVGGASDICNGAESTNQDKETANKTPLTEDFPRDEETGSLKKADSSETNTSVPTIKEYQDCGLCYEKLDLAKALKICDHLICENCVTTLRKSGLSNTCQICHKAAQIALQPLNGQMKSGVIEGSLSRHEDCATLYIDYDFPDGIQGPFHPHPGTPYDELSRRTFLPDNEEGREVLELLQKAFDACILFTVGKSMINEKDNQIIFNADIEHKININGGPTVSGYPDPEYLDRVKKQLKAKGIE